MPLSEEQQAEWGQWLAYVRAFYEGGPLGPHADARGYLPATPRDSTIIAVEDELITLRERLAERTALAGEALALLTRVLASSGLALGHTHANGEMHCTWCDTDLAPAKPEHKEGCPVALLATDATKALLARRERVERVYRAVLAREQADLQHTVEMASNGPMSVAWETRDARLQARREYNAAVSAALAAESKESG